MRERWLRQADAPHVVEVLETIREPVNPLEDVRDLSGGQASIRPGNPVRYHL